MKGSQSSKMSETEQHLVWAALHHAFKIRQEQRSAEDSGTSQEKPHTSVSVSVQCTQNKG